MPSVFILEDIRMTTETHLIGKFDLFLVDTFILFRYN